MYITLYYTILYYVTRWILTSCIGRDINGNVKAILTF